MSFKLQQADRKGHLSAFKSNWTPKRLNCENYVVSTSEPFDIIHSSNMEIQIGTFKLKALLDSGSSVSLIVSDLANRTNSIVDRKYFKTLLSSTGNNLKVIGGVLLPMQIGKMQTNHKFTVVSELVTPVILGRDFLSAHKLRLDFGNGFVESADFGDTLHIEYFLNRSRANNFKIVQT